MTPLDRILGLSTPARSPASPAVKVTESHDDGPVRTGSSKLERHYMQWLKSSNSFKPVGDVVLQATLPPAAYQVQSSMEGIYFERVEPKTDNLMIFEKSSMQKVVEEIDRFWNQKAAYDALGLMHNRGILLYGPPGTGKSICLQQVSELMVTRGDVVFFTKSASTIAEGLKALRQIEPDRRAVVAFEEADELARYDESSLLRLMDGDMKLDKVLFLGTTNYIDRMSPRMLRPGRFDKKVYVAPPTMEQRVQYLTVKAGKVATPAQIEDMARKTDGLSFGHLRELVAGVFAIGDPMPEVLARLREQPIRESGHFTYDYAKHKQQMLESRASVVEGRGQRGRNGPVDRLLG